MAQLQKDNKAFSKPLPFEMEIRELLDFSLPVSEWCWWKASDLAHRLTTFGKPSARVVGKALAKLVEEQEKNGVFGVSSLTRWYSGTKEYLIPLKKWE